MTRHRCRALPLAAAVVLTMTATVAAAAGVIPEGDLRSDPDARGFAELLFAQGRLAWAGADAEHALALFQRAAAAWPQDATYSFFAGHAELRLGRPEAAVSRLAQALPPAESRLPEWRVRSDVGMAHYLGGDAAAAERHLRIALELAPGDPGALFYLGLSLVDLERHGEAIAMFEAARRAAPVLTADSHYYTGVAALRSGDRDGARRELELALEHSHAVRRSIPEIRADARRYLEILGPAETSDQGAEP